ncbi:putative short-chain dehydrogenase/reductase SDR, NAD(P)-binding domain superfamily [Septoria linicola]|nr:putative short-chain dehydrogenase/reductase SDR, NAD(P)-binding domain superfamily [Septoria linicola]
MPPTTKAIAIIAGVGPGTGASVARRFAQSYPVVLLARNPENFNSLAEEINSSGGKAIGISTDLGDVSSVANAFKQIQSEFPDTPVAAAVYNASGRFVRKGLLDMAVEDFVAGYDVSVKGAFVFSQHSIPLLLKHAEKNASADTASNVKSGNYPPTLVFTGATASVKANALMSGFATAKFAMRALSTSIAKEFAPKGLHVAHAIIDGVIDIPRTKEWLKDQPPEAKIAAEDIAESYWNLHTQNKRAFTNEIDIRPQLEKW